MSEFCKEDPTEIESPFKAGDVEDDDQELQNMKDDVIDNQSDAQEEDDDAYSDSETRDKVASKNVEANQMSVGTANTAVSSGISMVSARSPTEIVSLQKPVAAFSKLPAAPQDEESEDEKSSQNSQADDPEQKSTLSKPYNNWQGVVPKDIEQRKEMMSFIAYANNLECSCKLISSSKQVQFSENPHEKNRIYLSGTSIMSTKLPVGLAHCKKICDQLREQPVCQNKIKRTNYLEKNNRT